MQQNTAVVHADQIIAGVLAAARIPPIAPPQGRITLTTGVSITTSDVSGATTCYYTPHFGQYVPCIVGSDVYMRTFTELSQATTDSTKSPAAVAASKVYDILLWDDAGTLRATRSIAWASDTSRGTGAGTAEIEFSSTYGFWVNKIAVTNGPEAGKGILLGSVRSNSSSQLVDSTAFGWVSNIFNAVPRQLYVRDQTDTWNQTTYNAWEQARAQASNQLDFLLSLGGMLTARAQVNGANDDTVEFGSTSIGIDGTSGPTQPGQLAMATSFGVANVVYNTMSSFNGYIALGRHYATWLTYASSTPPGSVHTWYGDGAGTIMQSGIAGEILG